jgi:hypothetical protein
MSAHRMLWYFFVSKNNICLFVIVPLSNFLNSTSHFDIHFLSDRMKQDNGWREVFLCATINNFFFIVLPEFRISRGIYFSFLFSVSTLSAMSLNCSRFQLFIHTSAFDDRTFRLSQEKEGNYRIRAENSITTMLSVTTQGYRNKI